MQSMINKYFSLWISDLMSLVPESLSRIFSGNDEKIAILFLDKYTAEFYRCRQGEASLIGSSLVENYSFDTALEGLRDSLVTVYLPENMLLRQQVALPRKAKKNLREVLKYEISRQTPFNEDDVYFDYIVEDDQSNQAVINAELVVTPKNETNAIYHGIEESGFTVDAISLLENEGNSLCSNPVMNFLSKDLRPVKPKLWIWYNKFAAVSLLLLLVIAAAMPFYQQRQTIQQFEAEIAIFEDKAVAARKLKDDIEIQASELAAVIEKKSRYPAVIQVLDELSKIIPNHTWLQRMEFDNARIELQGESGTASDLIGLLENSGLFKDTRFLSQVVQNPRSKAERFHLQSALIGSKEQ